MLAAFSDFKSTSLEGTAHGSGDEKSKDGFKAFRFGPLCV
jgi:hypothetical protein